MDARTVAKLYPRGKTITERAFVSSSEVRGASFSKMSVLFKIKVAEGGNGKPISHFSDHPDEREVLFTPGTQFEVVSKKKVKGQLHIVLREVPPAERKAVEDADVDETEGIGEDEEVEDADVDETEGIGEDEEIEDVEGDETDEEAEPVGR